MQTISRNNYEEYFLLYADNELDAETRLAVEKFIQQNTDLAIELEMLLQTKSLPENVLFNDKEILLRTEGNSIYETNHEEYFLLYIDNELSPAKRQEVETYVLQHPKLQDEFTTLKQAVLLPEVISFDDKKSLYRTEKKRIVYMKPWRLAAAAIFMGICATGWWLMQKPASHVTVADTHKVQDDKKQNTIKPTPLDSVMQPVKQEVPQVAQQTSPVKKENKNETSIVVSNKKKDESNKEKMVHNDGNNFQQQVVAEHPVIRQNNISKDEKEPPVKTKDVTSPNEDIGENNNDVAALQVPDNQQLSNGYKVYPASYKELNTNDDDRSLHVAMFDLNKTKVKNLLKKAGRLFGNKTNDLANDDGKLQVANFEIDTNKQ